MVSSREALFLDPDPNAAVTAPGLFGVLVQIREGPGTGLSVGALAETCVGGLTLRALFSPLSTCRVCGGDVLSFSNSLE